MSRQRVLGAVLAWLAVVATVSALVWVVISRAGDDLVASEQPLTTTGSGSAATASPRTPSGRPSRTPSKSPSRTPSATPSDDDPSASATPSAEPSATTTPSASPSTTPPPSSPSSPSSEPSAPANEERRTWQGRAGSIVATCQTAAVPLVTAQPANGFRAEVHREDALVDVEFEGREDESGLRVSVLVRCVSGVPSFSTHSEEDDD